MKLFLTSSSITPELRKEFLDVYGKDPAVSRCYFVPTAADVEQEKFYMCKSMDDLAEIGFNPVWYSLRYKNKELVQKELADADLVFVGGGNTFYLLDMARKSGFLEVIDDLVRNKGVAYGGISAGTILASQNIKVAGWKPDGDTNDVNLTDFNALGWVNFTPFVHYEKEEYFASIQEHKKEDEKVLAIPNGAMIVVNGSDIKLVGDIETI